MCVQHKKKPILKDILDDLQYLDMISIHLLANQKLSPYLVHPNLKLVDFSKGRQ